MKLGQTYGEHGHVEKGLELTLKAIDKDPYFVLAYLNKADLLNKVILCMFFVFLFFFLYFK